MRDYHIKHIYLNIFGILAPHKAFLKKFGPKLGGVFLIPLKRLSYENNNTCKRMWGYPHNAEKLIDNVCQGIFLWEWELKNVMCVKTQMKSFTGVDIKTQIIGYFSVESASKRLRQVL